MNGDRSKSMDMSIRLLSLQPEWCNTILLTGLQFWSPSSLLGFLEQRCQGSLWPLPHQVPKVVLVSFPADDHQSRRHPRIKAVGKVSLPRRPPPAVGRAKEHLEGSERSSGLGIPGTSLLSFLARPLRQQRTFPGGWLTCVRFYGPFMTSSRRTLPGRSRRPRALCSSRRPRTCACRCGGSARSRRRRLKRTRHLYLTIRSCSRGVMHATEHSLDIERHWRSRRGLELPVGARDTQSFST